jgi:hypothetical protein
MKREGIGRARPVHPLQWLWETLEDDPGFLLRPMFGGRSAYLDGRLVLYFAAKVEPWRGVLVCTDRERHASLLAEFPGLAPHAVLPKWLYLPEAADDFERIAKALVTACRRRDPRIGVDPGPPKRRRSGGAPGRRRRG